MQASKARLDRVKREVSSQLAEISGRLSQASETESIQELSPYDNHPADLGSETFARELDSGLRLQLQRRWDEVQRAEEKWIQGTYGQCDGCHQAIAEDRLRAVPEANFCLACQEKREVSYQPPPSETQVVPMPFGVVPEPESVELDGEDIWQSVARWGTSNSPQDVPPAVDYQETFVDSTDGQDQVETVDELVDEAGQGLLESARLRPLREARRTEEESAEY